MNGGLLRFGLQGTDFGEAYQNPIIHRPHIGFLVGKKPIHGAVSRHRSFSEWISILRSSGSRTFRLDNSFWGDHGLTPWSCRNQESRRGADNASMIGQSGEASRAHRSAVLASVRSSLRKSWILARTSVRCLTVKACTS